MFKYVLPGKKRQNLKSIFCSTSKHWKASWLLMYLQFTRTEFFSFKTVCRTVSFPTFLHRLTKLYVKMQVQAVCFETTSDVSAIMAKSIHTKTRISIDFDGA